MFQCFHHEIRNLYIQIHRYTLFGTCNIIYKIFIYNEFKIFKKKDELFLIRSIYKKKKFIQPFLIKMSQIKHYFLIKPFEIESIVKIEKYKTKALKI